MLERPGNVDVARPIGRGWAANSSSDADVHALPEPVDGAAVTRSDARADRHTDAHASVDHDAQADASAEAIPPSPRAPSELVRHGSRASHEIALTFDMGGRVGDALAIVDWLVDRRVRATIFMTGAMADNPNTDAGRQVLAIIDAHPELFTLGNHSYSHRDFRTLDTSEIRDELRWTAEVLGRYCSQEPRPFFRPPNGGYDADVLAAVGASGYRYTVTWDIDTIDWRPIKNDPPGPTADAIVAKVLGNAQGGSIVLMHLGGYETFEALPRIVDGLEAARYDLVTLDELVGG